MDSALANRDKVGVEDFILLEDFQNINAFVDNLKKRFKENLIYVRNNVKGGQLKDVNFLIFLVI